MKNRKRRKAFPVSLSHDLSLKLEIQFYEG